LYRHNGFYNRYNFIFAEDYNELEGSSNVPDSMLDTILCAIPGVFTKTRVGQKFFYYISERVTHITSLIMRQRPCNKRAFWPKKKATKIMEKFNNAANVLQPDKFPIFSCPPPPLGTVPKEFVRDLNFFKATMPDKEIGKLPIDGVVNSKHEYAGNSTNWNSKPLADNNRFDEVSCFALEFQKHCSLAI
jgi:hypothetical protein